MIMLQIGKSEKQKKRNLKMRLWVRYKVPVIIAVFIAVCFVSSATVLYSSHNQAHAGTPTCTWTGGGGTGNTNFSDAANWTCSTGTVPSDGTTIIFPTTVTAADRIAHNDLNTTAVTFSGIQFSGESSACSSSGFNYIITGTLPLAGDITDSTGQGCLDGGTTTLVGYQVGLTDIGTILMRSDVNYTGNSQIDFDGGFTLSTFNLSLANNGATTVGTNSSVPAQVIDAFSGSGSVTTSGTNNYLDLIGPSPAYTGPISIDGTLDVGGQYWTAAYFNQGLGTGTVTLTSGSNAIVYIDNSALGSAYTIPNNWIINSAPAQFPQISIAYPTVEQPTGVVAVLGSSYTELGSVAGSGKTIVFSGAITLNSNLYVQSEISSATFTGALSGSGFTISNGKPVGAYPVGAGGGDFVPVGSVIVSGSTNTTSTSNTTVAVSPTASAFVQTSNAVGQAYAIVGAFNFNLGTFTVGNVLLQSGGTLAGNGTTGNVTSQGGIISPGNSPGEVNSGNLTLDSSSSLVEQIGGTTPGTGYDQINVTGTVSLGSATLNTSLYNGFEPSLSDVYTIINNDGSDAVTGTFAGLAQGATFTVGDVTFTISYTGGTGNDVTLTATTVPGAPDTAGIFATPINILLPVAILAVAGSSLVIRHRYLMKFKAARR
jgi:fibronectin-binding autotransporter adhesin